MHAMITVRGASTRLPRKCFLPVSDEPPPIGYNVLQHVIDRASYFGFDPIVATTTIDHEIIACCAASDVKCYAGSSEDKALRWLEACKKFKVERFVTVDCDDPFFDPELTSRVFCIDGSVVGPDLRAYLGSHGWAFEMIALQEICARKKSEMTEMIWHHIPSDMPIIQFDARPDPIENGLRLTLDYEEDYWLLRVVMRELGPLCSREQIISFFTENRGLRIVNGFRNEEWKQRQSE